MCALCNAADACSDFHLTIATQLGIVLGLQNYTRPPDAPPLDPSYNSTANESASVAAPVANAALNASALNFTALAPIYATYTADGYNCSTPFAGVAEVDSVTRGAPPAPHSLMSQSRPGAFSLRDAWPRDVCPLDDDANGLRFLYPECDELLDCELVVRAHRLHRTYTCACTLGVIQHLGRTPRGPDAHMWSNTLTRMCHLREDTGEDLIVWLGLPDRLLQSAVRISLTIAPPLPTGFPSLLVAPRVLVLILPSSPPPPLLLPAPAACSSPGWRREVCPQRHRADMHPLRSAPDHWILDHRLLLAQRSHQLVKYIVGPSVGAAPARTRAARDKVRQRHHLPPPHFWLLSVLPPLLPLRSAADGHPRAHQAPLPRGECHVAHECYAGSRYHAAIACSIATSALELPQL